MTSIEAALQSVKGTQGLRLFPGLSKPLAITVGEQKNVRLPDAHSELLRLTNGFSGYWGYFRLFGFHCANWIDGEEWNRFSKWKFAWERHLGDEEGLQNFLFIGETGFGTQFGYRISDLGQANSAPVYSFQGDTMEQWITADSFAVFFEKYLAWSSLPYDEMIVFANSKYGALPFDEHVTFMPPLLVDPSGEPTIEKTVKMQSKDHMIVSGDLDTQLALEQCDRMMDGIEHFVDSLGRARVKVVWAK